MSANDLEWLPDDLGQADEHLLKIVRDQHQRIAYLEDQLNKLIKYGTENDFRIMTIERELLRIASQLEEIT